MSKTNGYNVINGAGWTPTIDIEFLGTIKNPSLGNRHLPISHAEAIEIFREKAEAQGMKLLNETGFLSPEQDKFIYVAESEHTEGEAYGLGFINFNDRSRSFVGLASQKVFACTNCCFGGVFAPSRTRHTLNVEERLDDKIQNVFNEYTRYVEEMQASMGFLKQREVDDALLGRILVQLHRGSVMGATNVSRIVAEYDNPTYNDKGEGKNGLRVYNAFTHILKNIKNPIQNIDTGHVGRKIILESLGY